MSAGNDGTAGAPIDGGRAIDWSRTSADYASHRPGPPARLYELLAALGVGGVGPKGAQGVPLSPGRSIAVDPQSVPYGTPVWLDTTEPLATRPLRRLVVAQDTGSAIVGAVRADYFWGWGGDAEAAAGRMKQPLRMWVLWPAS